MTEAKEPGRVAYEAWCASHGRDQAWRLLHPLDQLAWGAAERASAGLAESAKAEAQPAGTGWVSGDGRFEGFPNGTAAWLCVEHAAGRNVQVDRFNAYSREWELTPHHGVIAYMLIEKPLPPPPERDR